MSQLFQVFQVDAFSHSPYGGNPAAVCPLPEWPEDDKLQAFATELNLPATAFFVENETGFQIRWFTTLREIELCGHASLATAWVLYNRLGYTDERIRFESQSGELIARNTGNGWIELDFPIAEMKPTSTSDALWEGLGAHPIACLSGLDIMAVFDDESIIRELQPDLQQLAKLPVRGVIATAPGKDCDFVSRFFAPRYGIDEDSVTGSAHCALTPYWAQRMKKTEFVARQLSKRGGEIRCSLKDQRVFLSGQAAEIIKGNYQSFILGL